MSVVNGFQVGSDTLKYNYESLENYNTPNFSTSSSQQYTVGDYVTYQGKLYRCTTETTGGTWVSGSWTLAVLSDDLKSVISDVGDCLATKAPAIIDTASGGVVSFSNGADDMPIKSIVANIDLVQDLHGYSEPWPAGGGKNKYPNQDKTVTHSTYTVTAVFKDGNVKLTGTAGSSGGRTIYRSDVFALPAGTYYLKIFNLIGTGTIGGFIPQDGSTVITKDADGKFTIASDTTNFNVGINVTSGQTYNCSFDICVATENISSYMPYSNICPISGWTGANVARTGANVWRQALPADVSGTYCGWYIPYNDSITVKIIDKGNNADISGVYFGLSTTGINASGLVWWNINNGTINVESRTSSDLHYVTLFPKTQEALTKLLNRFDVMVTIDGDGAAYVPYAGTTLPINWQSEAGTIYSGSITVNDDGSADLVADYAKIVFDGVTNKVNVASTSYIGTNVTRGYKSAFAVGAANPVVAISDCALYATSAVISADKQRFNINANTGETNIWLYNSETGVVSTDTTAQAVTKLNDYLAAHNLTIVYKLATSVTYHLTGIDQISTLLGTNNIWMDCGDITNLEYVVDTKTYIQRDDVDLLKSATLIIESVSGTIANFPDGADGIPVKDLTVGIEPVQDLHGYDNPWPSGGGKNKCHNIATSQTVNGVTFTVNSDGTFTANGTASGGSAILRLGLNTLPAGRYVANGLSSEGGSSTFRLIVTNSTYASAIATCTYVSGTAFTLEEETTVGYQFVVSNGVTVSNLKISPMIRPDSYLDAIFVPYSNVCPIIGWTGCNIYRTGKNLLNCQIEGKEQNGIISSNNLNGSIHLQGTTTGARFYTYLKNNFKLNQGTYRLSKNLSLTSGSISVQLQGFNSANQVISRHTVGNSYTDTSVSITEPASYYNVFIDITNMTTSTAVNLNLEIQLELGSTTSAWEQSYGTTIPVSWQTEAGTIYSGTVTLNEDGSATLTKEYGSITFDGSSDENFSVYGTGFYTSISDMKSGNGLNGWCDTFPVNVSVTPFGVKLGANNKIAYFTKIQDNISGVTDVTTWKTWLSTNNVTIVYPLATTVTYHLTGIDQIQTLYGINNIWADCGSITNMEYVANTKLYIQRLTQPTEDDMVANNNIASGKYFMVGNSLYLATTAILAGEKIIPASNCTAISLAQALNAINS